MVLSINSNITCFFFFGLFLFSDVRHDFSLCVSCAVSSCFSSCVSSCFSSFYAAIPEFDVPSLFPQWSGSDMNIKSDTPSNISPRLRMRHMSFSTQNAQYLIIHA
jgi:hypothetical protein